MSVDLGSYLSCLMKLQVDENEDEPMLQNFLRP